MICKSMFYRATSDRTLNVACDDIGYEGKNWDLNFEVQPNQFEIIRYQMMRSLSWYLREGEYTPEPFHRKKIPKRSGGTRVLHIPTEDDRVVQRGIYLTVGPYLDACFHDFSFGWRPEVSRLHALASHGWAATSQDRYWVVIADIKDAFPSTPRLRVRELVRKYLLQTEDICDLIDLTLSPHKKGLPQGSPLSPMLLNLYLHHNLDRKWHQLGLDIPLLRYADDIMLLCKSESEARQGYRELVKQLANAGLQLKHGIESCVCDTRTQQPVEWLGFSMKMKRYCVRIGASTWSSLDLKLREIGPSDESGEKSEQVLESWLGQHVPALNGKSQRRSPKKSITCFTDIGFRFPWTNTTYCTFGTDTCVSGPWRRSGPVSNSNRELVSEGGLVRRSRHSGSRHLFATHGHPTRRRTNRTQQR